MFENILLAFDGSVHAQKAALVAGDLAWQYRASLCLETVLKLSQTI